MRENPVHRLVKSGLTPAEAVDYWAYAWEGRLKREWANQRGTSEETIDQNLQNAVEKVSESPEVVHQAVAGELSSYLDGELTRSEDDEGIFMLSEQPEDLQELENELGSRFTGHISLMVLGRATEDGYEEVHVRIADIV